MAEHLVLVASRLLVLMLGAAITMISYKAYRRMRSKVMLLVALGFGFITMGILMEGLLYEFTPLSLVASHTVESSITLTGILILLYAVKSRFRGGR